jgi:hypothetical protein
VEQAEIREQVDDLLLAEVTLSRRPVRWNPERAQLLLVPLGVGAGGEDKDDVAGSCGVALDQLVHALGNRFRFCASPVRRLVPREARLVGYEQLDGRSEDWIREIARGTQRLEFVTEVGAEEVIDDGEHLRPRAVVLRERQDARRRASPLAENLHVCMAESVDRLKLVADEEDLPLAAAARQQVDQLALQPVRVLELVDHDRREAELLAGPDRLVVAEHVARAQLQVLEVEGRLAVLGVLVGAREPGQQLLQQIAVAGGELVERGLLDAAPCLLVRRRPLASKSQTRKVEEPLRPRLRLGEHECIPRGLARRVARRRVVDQAARRVAELGEARLEARPLTQLEDELTAGGAQRLEDADQHAAQVRRAVDGE